MCGGSNQKKGAKGESGWGAQKKTRDTHPPAPASPRKIKLYDTLFPYFVSISNRRQNACFTDARKKEKKRIRAHFLRETRIETRSGEVVRTSSRRSRREEDS